MTLFESLPTSYEYLIIAFKIMPMKKLMMAYVMARVVHEMLKCKEEEP